MFNRQVKLFHFELYLSKIFVGWPEKWNYWGIELMGGKKEEHKSISIFIKYFANFVVVWYFFFLSNHLIVFVKCSFYWMSSVLARWLNQLKQKKLCVMLWVCVWRECVVVFYTNNEFNVFCLFLFNELGFIFFPMEW